MVYKFSKVQKTIVLGIFVWVLGVIVFPTIASAAYVSIYVTETNGATGDTVNVLRGSNSSNVAQFGTATASVGFDTTYSVSNYWWQYVPVPAAGNRLNKTYCNTIGNPVGAPLNPYQHNTSTCTSYFFTFEPIVNGHITFTVNGSGTVDIFKNGQLYYNAYQGIPTTGTFSNGDEIIIHAIPDSGYQFFSMCDIPFTECQYTATYSDIILDVGQLGYTIETKFIAMNPTPTPTPTPSTTPSPTPAPVMTPIIVPTPSPDNPLQKLMFEVVGQGQMYALRNGNIEALATPGHTVNVSYIIGDTIGFTAYAYLNNHLVNVCDFPYTECRTDVSYNFNVIGDLPDKMIATFQSNNTNGSMPLIFQAIGQGQVYAFKNGSLEGLATPGHDATVYYKIGDTIGFNAYAYLNNTLISMCDYPFTECQTQTGYSYTVIGQLPQKMIATFTNHVNTVVPTPPAPPTNPGTTPIINPITPAVNDLWSLIAGVLAGLTPGAQTGLAIMLILGGVLGGASMEGRKFTGIPSIAFGVIAIFISAMLGLISMLWPAAIVAIGIAFAVYMVMMGGKK